LKFIRGIQAQIDNDPYEGMSEEEGLEKFMSSMKTLLALKGYDAHFVKREKKIGS
jgi:hypothetical protein